jgi:calcineurin-like phosphoesterase
VKINGIIVTVDSGTRKADHIERLRIDAEYEDKTNYDSDDGKPEYFNTL